MQCIGKVGCDHCLEFGPRSSHQNFKILQLDEPPEACIANVGKQDSKWAEHLDFSGEIDLQSCRG